MSPPDGTSILPVRRPASVSASTRPCRSSSYTVSSPAKPELPAPPWHHRPASVSPRRGPSFASWFLDSLVLELIEAPGGGAVQTALRDAGCRSALRCPHW